MKFPLEKITSKLTFWRGEANIFSGTASYGSTTQQVKSVQKTTEGDKSDLKKGNEPSREQWSNPIEFLLSCVAMSVGLGNVWRFPFVAYENGGGAFLIPYIIVLVFIGKPLYYMELCLGQFASKGPVKVWELAPAFKGIGYGQMIATWCVVTYYVSLMALTVFYFFASFNSALPWATCGNWSSPDCVDTNSTSFIISSAESSCGKWCSADCVDTDINMAIATGDTKPSCGKWSNPDCSDSAANIPPNLKSSSDEYFNLEVLQIDPNGLKNGIDTPEWRLSLCLLFSWLVLFVVLVKGVASSGKVAYFTALFPYFVLFILLIRGVTLPGAYEGVLFFITPEWGKLLELNVWYAAVSQSFFSLSVGFGSITMFASYNGFRHNVYRDATIISVTDTLTSLLAGFTIFAILGHLADQLGLCVKDVIKEGGTSLAFVSYPDVLARFTLAPQFFAVMFFLMLFTLGVGSASALTGCVITIICDQFPSWKKPFVTLAVCVAGFLLGLFYVTPQGQYILTLVDYYGGGFIIFILAAMEVVAVQWVYGIKNFSRDIEFMLNRKTGWYWKICWAFIIPVGLIVIFIYVLAVRMPLTHGSYMFDEGANAFGILLTVTAIGMLPLLFIIGLCKTDDKTPFFESVRSLFRPSEHWGPHDPELYCRYKDYVEGRLPPIEGIDNPIEIIDEAARP